MTTITERVERGAALPDGHECEAIWEFFGIEAECGMPAVGLYRRACIHEHIYDGWLCGEHAATPERGLCQTCYRLPGELSHECPITIAEVAA
jgi:hypothetical protein